MDEVDCISLHANALKKLINRSVLPTPAIDKIAGKTELFSHGKEKKNSKFKEAFLTLKIDQLSLPLRNGGVG